MKRHNKPRGASRAALAAFAADHLELLEARTLLSGFTYESAADAFHLDRLIRPLQLPAGAEMTNFGAVVTTLGDIDDDGTSDFAVSAPGALNDDGRWEGDAGSVYLFSGSSFTLIRTLTDSTAGFGSAVVSLGDVNDDGVPDLAIGSPSADMNANATLDFVGSVGVYSGADGAIIWSRNGAGFVDEFGWAVAAAGDVDGDGIADIIVGAPGAGGVAAVPGPGAAHVFSGIDGVSLGTFTGETAGDRFGHAVDGGIDLPLTLNALAGDGVLDYLIGAPGSDAGGAGAGRAYAIDGALLNNRLVFTGEPGDEAGTAVAILGHGSVDDGSLTRLAIGKPGYESGRGTVSLYHVTGGVPDPIGTAAMGTRFGSQIRQLDLIEESTGASFYTILAPLATDARLTLYPGNTTNAFDIASASIHAGTSLAVVGDLDADGIIDAVAGFTGAFDAPGQGGVRVVPLPLISGLQRAPMVLAASDNGMNFILGGIIDISNPAAVRPGYVVLNGEIISTFLLAGMPPDGVLQAVNSSGVFFGQRGEAPNNSPYVPMNQLFLLENGAPAFVADAAMVGRTPSGLRFIKLSDAGDVIFDGLVDGVGQRGFLLRGGVLYELGAAHVQDINNAGTVVARPSGSPDWVLLHADGSTTILPNFEFVMAINNDGMVVGITPHNNQELATWHNGVFTVISEGITPPDGALQHTWIPVDLDDHGRILARFEWEFFSPRPPSVYPGINFLFTPEDEPRDIRDLTTGEGDDLGLYISSAQLLTSGVIIFEGAALIPAGVPQVSDAVLGGTAVGPNGIYLAGIDQDGETILLRRDGIRFTGGTLDLAAPLGSVESVVTYVDTRDGLAYAVVRTSTDRLVWYRQQSDGSFGAGVLIEIDKSESIAGRLTTFTSTDGRVHVAGVSADGEVLIYYQTNLAPSDSLENWAFENLNTGHLRPQGRPEPAFNADTDLAGYTTAWGGMNLAGINTEGQIEVVWWAPGLVLWSAANLSEAAGTPTVTGRLAPFVAPWGGIHLAAVDEAGHLQSTWWAPGLDQWAHDDLTSEFGGALLAPDSLTAYVTGWEGLNIAGIDADTGEAAVYWWTPTTDGWITETLDLGEDGPLFQGALESAVRGTNLNIFGATQDGALVRLYWYPSQGGRWLIEDVQASLGGPG